MVLFAFAHIRHIQNRIYGKGGWYYKGVVDIMKGLESISPIGLTLLSIAIAMIFVLSFDSDELDVLGNAFIGIGGIMIITATQGDFLNGLNTLSPHKGKNMLRAFIQ